MRRQRPARRGEEHGCDYIESRERRGNEIQPESRDRNGCQVRVAGRIEYVRDRPGAEENDEIDGGRNGEHEQKRHPENPPGRAGVAGAPGAADDRLNALRYARIQGQHDQGNVGDDSVCRHADIALQPEKNRVERDHHDAGRGLGHQRGETE